jgi:hypothetical protein
MLGSHRRTTLVVVATAMATVTNAFTASSFTNNVFGHRSQSISSQRLRMAIETIEYTIYPDGRIEERVRGVKGDNCHKITDDIHQQLGEVIATQPTEEMYEQEIKVDQTLTNSVGESGDSWTGGTSW